MCLCVLAQVEQDAPCWELAQLWLPGLPGCALPPALGTGWVQDVPTGRAALSSHGPCAASSAHPRGCTKGAACFLLPLEKAPAPAETEHVRGLVFVYERFV